MKQKEELEKLKNGIVYANELISDLTKRAREIENELRAGDNESIQMPGSFKWAEMDKPLARDFLMTCFVSNKTTLEDVNKALHNDPFFKTCFNLMERGEMSAYDAIMEMSKRNAEAMAMLKSYANQSRGQVKFPQLWQRLYTWDAR